MRMPPADHPRPAIPFAVATTAILLFTTMDAVIKALPSGIPALQIGAMRFAFGIPVALVALWWLASGWPSPASWRANALRGLLIATSSTLFFIALRRLPFAEVLALTYVGPLLIAVLATTMLGEPLRPSVVAAVLLGLAGVAVIAWDNLNGADGLAADSIGIAAAIGSAAVYALNMVLLRRQAQRDRPGAIVLIQNVVPALLLLPAALPGWHAPDSAGVWLVFLLLAALGVGGHLLLTWAFARAPAGILAVVDYLALPYAAVIGFLVFAEIPSPAVWLGAALIVGACLVVTRRRA